MFRPDHYADRHILFRPCFCPYVEEAVTTGLKNNPEMQAFRLEEDAAKGQMQRRSCHRSRIPSSKAVFDSRPAAGDPGGAFRNNQIGLSQSVEVAGQRGLRIDAATNSLERTRLDIRDLERKLRADIRDGLPRRSSCAEREALTREYLRIQEELSESCLGEVSGGGRGGSGGKPEPG